LLSAILLSALTFFATSFQHPALFYRKKRINLSQSILHMRHTPQTAKLLLIWDRMGDYHRARWDALSTEIGKENCFAADLGSGDGLYQWANTKDNPNYFRLSPFAVDKVPANAALKAFKQIVRQHNITHVCIPGYGRLVYCMMLVYCRAKGIKTLMFAESWYPGNYIFDKLKGLFIRLTANRCLVSGKRAAEHFRQRLGIKKHKIVEGYSVVDNVHFASSPIAKTHPRQLLCVARFAPEKNLHTLIEAFKKSELSNSWTLRIVGGGPLADGLKALVGNAPILLDHWLHYDELPDMYAAASAFVLPSAFEPWGLVVNEAMAAGLPIVVSDQVGALPDLLENNTNGWSFLFDDAGELSDIFNRLTKLSPTELGQMGQASKNIISRFTPQGWAQSIASKL
jgi:1,2-diacylglycerol 3-alpha-glucosyltransferase